MKLTASVAIPDSLRDALPGPSAYGCSPELAALLIRLVLDRGCRDVLEFGAGASSVAFARALEASSGGCLTSLEQSPEWCAEQWSRVEQCRRVDARLIQVELRGRLTRSGWLYGYWAAADQLKSRSAFDLVLVDAPQFYFGGRDAAMLIAAPYLKPGALIVADDADRANERAMVRHWTRVFPGLRVLEHAAGFGGKGVAILSYESPGERWSPRTTLGTTLRSTRWWLSRVKNKPDRKWKARGPWLA